MVVLVDLFGIFIKRFLMKKMQGFIYSVKYSNIYL